MNAAAVHAGHDDPLSLTALAAFWVCQQLVCLALATFLLPIALVYVPLLLLSTAYARARPHGWFIIPLALEVLIWALVFALLSTPGTLPIATFVRIGEMYVTGQRYAAEALHARLSGTLPLADVPFGAWVLLTAPLSLLVASFATPFTMVLPAFQRFRRGASLQENPTRNGMERSGGNARSPMKTQTIDAARAPLPPEQPWVIENVIPDCEIPGRGILSLLVADGGLGKSTFAIYLATVLLVGERFLAQYTVSRRKAVVFFDVELHQGVFLRRAAAIARGLGFGRPPKGLYYHRLNGPITDPDNYADLRRVLAKRKADFAIFDSLTMGTAGVNQASAGDLTEILKGLLEPTGIPWLIIDHVASTGGRKREKEGLRPYGGVMKWNNARSVLGLLGIDGFSGFVMHHVKSNLGPLQQPLTIERHEGVLPCKVVPPWWNPFGKVRWENMPLTSYRVVAETGDEQEEERPAAAAWQTPAAKEQAEEETDEWSLSPKERVLSIVQQMVAADGYATLPQVMLVTGFPKTTAWRLLVALKNAGILVMTKPESKTAPARWILTTPPEDEPDEEMSAGETIGAESEPALDTEGTESA